MTEYPFEGMTILPNVYLVNDGVKEKWVTRDEFIKMRGAKMEDTVQTPKKNARKRRGVPVVWAVTGSGASRAAFESLAAAIQYAKDNAISEVGLAVIDRKRCDFKVTQKVKV